MTGNKPHTMKQPMDAEMTASCKRTLRSCFTYLDGSPIPLKDIERHTSVKMPLLLALLEQDIALPEQHEMSEGIKDNLLDYLKGINPSALAIFSETFDRL